MVSVLFQCFQDKNVLLDRCYRKRNLQNCRNQHHIPSDSLRHNNTPHCTLCSCRSLQNWHMYLHKTKYFLLKILAKIKPNESMVIQQGQDHFLHLNNHPWSVCNTINKYYCFTIFAWSTRHRSRCRVIPSITYSFRYGFISTLVSFRTLHTGNMPSGRLVLTIWTFGWNFCC